MILELLNRSAYHSINSKKAKMHYSIFVVYLLFFFFFEKDIVYLLDCSHPVQVHKMNHKHSVIESI